MVTVKGTMKVDATMRGGIAGLTTLGLLTHTLGRSNGHATQYDLLGKGKLKKRLKKTGSKNGLKATKEYIELAEDILASAASFGIGSLSKKKNAMLKAGILGTAVGLGNVFLNESNHGQHNGQMGSGRRREDDKLSSKLLKVSLYTIGGLIAGKLAEGSKKKSKRKKH
jgi:hypothetical protein